MNKALLDGDGAADEVVLVGKSPWSIVAELGRSFARGWVVLSTVCIFLLQKWPAILLKILLAETGVVWGSFVGLCVVQLVENQIMTAATWHRWRAALLLTRVMRLLTWWIPNREWRMQRDALGILARLGLDGDVDRALTRMERWKGAALTQQKQYWRWMARLYWWTNLRQEAIVAAEHVLSIEPATAEGYLDLAEYLIRARGDTGAARALIAQAEQLTLRPVDRAYAVWLDGLALVDEGAFAKAVTALKDGLCDIRLVANNSQLPAIEALTAAHLCLAHAGCGDVDRAREQFRRARPWLLATREEWLLERCYEAINPPDPTRNRALDYSTPSRSRISGTNSEG